MPHSIHARLALLGAGLLALTACDRGEDIGSLPKPRRSPAVSVAKFVPENDKVLFIMGQDSDTLADYKAAVQDDAPLGAPPPFAVTLYTNNTNTAALGNEPWRALGGLPRDAQGNFSQSAPAAPVTGASGQVDFRGTLDAYPQSGLAVGLYLADPWQGCINQPLRGLVGRADPDIAPAYTAELRANVDRLGQYFKSLNRPVFLRVGYEFDGPWNCYDPELYKAAFRVIHDRINAIAGNVAFVWQSAVWARPYDNGGENADPATKVPYGWLRDFRFSGENTRAAFERPLSESDPNFGQPHLSAWYPGDEYVDWVALSYFSGPDWKNQWGNLAQGALYAPTSAQSAVLKFARAHAKPVLIAEASPQGYDLEHLRFHGIDNSRDEAVTPDQMWSAWYDPFFKFVADNRDVIAAAAYINTNWKSQPQWQCAAGAAPGSPECSGGYWGDARVQINADIRDRFLNEVKKPLWQGGR